MTDAASVTATKSVEEVARDFAALCKAGELDAAGEKYWADDIVSIEPMTGDMAVLQGTAAVKAKGEWWYANHEVHQVTTDGPYVDGDKFILRFTLDVTPKGGERMQADELGVYTVRGGLVVEERFIMALPTG
jgi:ketosteroid isomerase-like protein